MAELINVLQQTGVSLAYVIVGLLCLAGLGISCVSLSGTWLVTLGALIAAFLSGPRFPGLRTVIVFLMISGVVEGVEAIAGPWGVQRRGGSSWAGLAALIGGLAGLYFGTAIPVPLIGSAVGMLAGGFMLTFLVERHRLKKSSHAAHIAMGAVMGRVVIIFVKVIVTLGMIVALAAGLIISGGSGDPSS